MSRRASSRGFTMLEILFVSVLGALALASAGAVFEGSNRLSAQAHLRIRALSLHRTNLRALAQVLAPVQGSSLTGFDGAGASTAPAFRRVAGATKDTLTLGEAESLVWRATVGGVDGVTSPGAVYLARASGDRIIARNVPQGGFLVRRQGKNLTVRLTTYQISDEGRMQEVTSNLTVSVRN